MDPNNELSINFEEDKWKAQVPAFEDETPKMVKLVMKWSGGAIQDQRQAEYLLLGFVILLIGVSLFLFLRNSKENVAPPQNIINEALEGTIQSYPN